MQLSINMFEFNLYNNYLLVGCQKLGAGEGVVRWGSVLFSYLLLLSSILDPFGAV